MVLEDAWNVIGNQQTGPLPFMVVPAPFSIKLFVIVLFQIRHMLHLLSSLFSDEALMSIASFTSLEIHFDWIWTTEHQNNAIKKKLKENETGTTTMGWVGAQSTDFGSMLCVLQHPLVCQTDEGYTSSCKLLRVSSVYPVIIVAKVMFVELGSSLKDITFTLFSQWPYDIQLVSYHSNATDSIFL